VDERARNGGGDGRLDIDVDTSDATVVEDFAKPLIVRAGQSMCRIGQAGSRIGEAFGELALDLVGAGGPGPRAVRMIRADALCANAERNLEDMLELIRAARELFIEQARIATEQERILNR
jgi:hypothetical protein